MKLNYDLQLAGEEYRIEPDIVEFAGLAHDLGHPPFGHFGEEILNKMMFQYGGFEGNAQTLRIITRIEKKHRIDSRRDLDIASSGDDKRVGLNLTARSIASILKYDNQIMPQTKKRRQIKPIKGFYTSEKGIVDWVKRSIYGDKSYSDQFKTIECQIMDIADDIAYSTYDLEDSFKAGFLEPIDLLCSAPEVLTNVAKKVSSAMGIGISKEEIREEIAQRIFFDIFKLPEGMEDYYKKPSRFELEEFSLFSITNAKNISRSEARDGYHRTKLTSLLVGAFVEAVEIDEIDRDIPALSTVKIQEDRKMQIEILKHFVYESQILSPKIQIVAYRSKEIVQKIFETLSDRNEQGYFLLPPDYRRIYEACGRRQHQMRTICDFIAGMTDRYALEFYGRLTSENPETIFKPL